MPNHRALRSLACALSLLLACTDKGDDTTEETTTGSQTTDAETTETQPTVAQPTDAQTTDAETTASAATDGETTDSETGASMGSCECAAGDPCGVQLCETAVLDQDEDTGGQDDAALAAALTCALEALRDRKAGRVSWNQRSGSGQFDQYGHFEMFGDGTARHTVGGVADLCESVVDAVDLVTLQSSEIFAACLNDTVLEERFACLRQARLEYQSTCVEGVDDCGGV